MQIFVAFQRITLLNHPRVIARYEAIPDRKAGYMYVWGLLYYRSQRRKFFVAFK
jgi:hypothetical protein